MALVLGANYHRNSNKRDLLYMVTRISSTRGGVQAIAQVTIPSAFPVVDEVAEVSVSTQQDQRSVKTSKACHHKRKSRSNLCCVGQSR